MSVAVKSIDGSDVFKTCSGYFKLDLILLGSLKRVLKTPLRIPLEQKSLLLKEKLKFTELAPHSFSYI